jgi:threonine synthase
MTTDFCDGRPLLARYDLTGVRGALEQTLLQPRSRGMWRRAPLLPVRDWRHIASLGEGSTPLLPAPRLGDALACPGLLVKAEGLNPTGSFKARGMAAAVSRAVELGARRLLVPSAGNAGGALAVYAAVAGVDATVLMPADAPESNQDEVHMCGWRLILVDGLIDDCGRLSALIAEHTGAFDLSTLKKPYRVEGKKTMGLELAEELGWDLPDVIVYPTAAGPDWWACGRRSPSWRLWVSCRTSARGW